MASQCYHSVEQIVKFDSAAIETKTLLLEKSVDAILTEIHDAAAQLPICRIYDKLNEEETFCKMPLKTAIGLGASLDIDSLDFAENVRTTDKTMVLFTSFVQKGNTCVYKTKQELIFDTHCSETLDLIRHTLQIDNKFDASIGSRLFVGETMFSNNTDGILENEEVYGKFSSDVKNFIIENINLISQIDEFLNNIRGIYDLVGNDFLNLKMKKLEGCFGKQILSFQAAINLNPRRLHVCLGQVLKDRSKRSSVLSYLFSNGQELDNLNNVVVDLAGTMNENIQSIAKNEDFLFQKEKELVEQSLSSAKKLERLKSSFNALNFEVKHKFHIEHNNLNNIYKFNQKMLNLNQIKTIFNEQSNLIFDIIISSKELACYSLSETVCLNPKSSWLQLEGGNIVIHGHELKPSPKATAYISCIPEWKNMMVSKLHNSHMMIDGTGLLVGDGLKIRIQDLGVAPIVNKEMVDLSEFLIQDNIFITAKNNLLGISCEKDELVFVGSQKVKCGRNVVWTNSSNDIFSARGTISRSTISNFYQQSKLNLDLIEDDQLDDFLTLEESNATSITAMLENLSKLPTTHKVGMSLGVSGFIIITFVLAIVCTRLCWSNSICCQPHPGITKPEPDIVGQQGMSEDQKESLTRRATEMVMSQLRGQ